jgi:ABC-type phosphate transport system permease subunit
LRFAARAARFFGRCGWLGMSVAAIRIDQSWRSISSRSNGAWLMIWGGSYALCMACLIATPSISVH